MSSRKDIASAMAAGFSQGERSFAGDDTGLARLQYSAGSIHNNTGEETTMSAYTLSQAKINSTSPGIVNPNTVSFNYQSQNESPLIKLVKESSASNGGGPHKPVMSQSTS